MKTVEAYSVKRLYHELSEAGILVSDKRFSARFEADGGAVDLSKQELECILDRESELDMPALLSAEVPIYGLESDSRPGKFIAQLDD